MISMLPSTKTVNIVYTEFPNVIDLVNKDCIMLDCSTIVPDEVKNLYNLAQKQDKVFIDAPVSGGVVGAQNGTLTFMVGADNETNFNKVEPMLQSMGKNIVNCNMVSGGQIAKTCNNMALAIQMASVSEAFNLGIKLGMDPKILNKIMGTASSRCWSLDTYNPVPGILENVPASRDYENGFKTDLMMII